MTVVTRVAGSSDYSAIVEIYNQAIASNATGHLEKLTVDDRRDWLASHDQNHPLLVAERGGTVAGWASIGSYRPGRGAFRYTAELSYYVDVEQRRSGIATALVSRAIELCDSCKLRTLIAILLADNEASIRLLNKFGFEQWACLPGIANFGGREVDHVYYGLRVIDRIQR
jgi:phosphinothricin acetyltransferase